MIVNWYDKNRQEMKIYSILSDTVLMSLDKIDLRKSDKIQEGKAGLEFLYEGVYRKVNSRDIEREAERMLRGLSKKKEHILFVPSVANLSLLKSMSMEMNWQIILCEANPYILKYMMEKYDLSFLWERGNVVLIYTGEPDEEIIEKLQRLGVQHMYLALNIYVLSNPNSWCYRKQYIYILQTLKNILSMALQTYGTDLGDKFKGGRNLYQNLGAIVKSYDLDEVKGKFRGYPAIVVASGPSLEKNIDLVQKAQGKAVIIACDASLEALKSHGVNPDAIASIEREESTYKSFYQGKTFSEALVLFGPTTLWPKTLEEYPGKMVLCHRLNRGDDAIVEQYFGNIKNHGSIGWSCANLALMYADYMSCSPIILIGQDLAYTNGKFHSDETHIKEVEGENDTSTSDGTMVEDIYGNMVPSRQEYILYKNWIEAMIGHHKINVVDATEGGAKIVGSKIMTLQEAIDRYCKEIVPFHVYDCLPAREGMNEEVYIQKLEALREHLIKMNMRVKHLEEESLYHYQMLKKLPQKEELEKMERKELEAVLKKLRKGEEIIRIILNDEDVNEFMQQHINQTIIRIKTLGNEVTPENVSENIYQQQVLMAYLHDSCLLVYDEYQTYVEALEKQKKSKNL
jgi:hypothetical protein